MVLLYLGMFTFCVDIEGALRKYAGALGGTRGVFLVAYRPKTGKKTAIASVIAVVDASWEVSLLFFFSVFHRDVIGFFS